MPEGDLTRLRAALVRTETLADVALQCHLGEVLRIGRGEETSGGPFAPQQPVRWF
jgi:ribonuclease III